MARALKLLQKVLFILKGEINIEFHSLYDNNFTPGQNNVLTFFTGESKRQKNQQADKRRQIGNQVYSKTTTNAHYVSFKWSKNAPKNI